MLFLARNTLHPADAPPEIMKKVARIEAVRRRDEAPLAAGAPHHRRGHPSISAVVPGAVTPESISSERCPHEQQNPEADVRSELKHEGLLWSDHPTFPSYV